MEISIIIQPGTLDIEKALNQEEVTVTGIVTSTFIKSNGLSQALEKAEMFENLIDMGIIAGEDLEAIGYYKVGEDNDQTS